MNFTKKVLSLKLLIILITFAAVSRLAAYTPAKLTLHFFGSRTCGECMQIKEELLKPLVNANISSLGVEYHDIDNDSELTLCIAMEKKYGVKGGAAQELFFPDTVLCGFEAIMKSGRQMIALYLKDPAKWGTSKYSVDTSTLKRENRETLLKEKFDSFTLWGLVSAGLLDGINPCAIATLVFLVSFLSVRKRRRSEIIIVGMFYTVTVYLTYLFMGIGALGIITGLIKTPLISQCLKWGVIAFAFIVAVLSLRDAVVYVRKGDSKDMKVQLPKVLKLRIHKIISQNLSGTQLVIGAIIAGFLVTILEAVCTGQFYIPVLTAMAAKNDPGAWVYLLFYNFLFVFPLVVVMVLAVFGMKWEKLAKSSQRSLAVVKVLLGITLLALCVYLFFTM
jgi:hypothetical protein